MHSSEDFPHLEDAYKLIGIAMEIHNILGRSFSGIVYKDAFELELQNRGIKYERKKEYCINYKGLLLKHSFYSDFVVENSIILELKSRTRIIEDHYAQVLNYLAISKLKKKGCAIKMMWFK